MADAQVMAKLLANFGKFFETMTLVAGGFFSFKKIPGKLVGVPIIC